MRIVVLGAGTVGQSIASLLCLNRHSVTVVDTNADHIRRINETLDVRAIHGSASESSVLFQTGISGADLCLAVTGIFLNLAKESHIANDFLDHLRIKAPNTATLCRNLSGGNRQKVVLSKWLAADSEVLILNNPTRGVDVGAKAEIYQLMMNLKQQGLAILMISEELPELLGMSDRMLIVRKRRISAEFSRSDHPTEEEVIQHMI